LQFQYSYAAVEKISTGVEHHAVARTAEQHLRTVAEALSATAKILVENTSATQ